MAWTTPMTAVDNTIFTSSQWNTYVRDNMNQTLTALASAANQTFATTGTNAMAVRTVSSDVDAGSSTSSSTSYAILADALQTQVTLTTGTQALVFIQAELSHGTTLTDVSMSYAVTSATTSAAADSKRVLLDGVLATSGNRLGGFFWDTSLNAGSNIFSMQYKTSAGTLTAAKREIVVWGF